MSARGLHRRSRRHRPSSCKLSAIAPSGSSGVDGDVDRVEGLAPRPRRAHRVREVGELGPPPKLPHRFGRARPQLRGVPGPPRPDHVGHCLARGGLDRADHLKHRGPAARADVVHQGPAWVQVPQRVQVCAHQVRHVDVVPHAGAVPGLEVAPGDDELLAEAEDGLERRVHHPRVLLLLRVGEHGAHAALGIRANHVEVPQARRRELRPPGVPPAHGGLHEDGLLRVKLGEAVWVGRPLRRGLHNGELCGVTKGGA
mmetsp:Transcript_14515/g.49132  ORF Transcript_14515/g.49132 Transcript_14515/m.49132 type:complete len:256 (+) Transcript_14515:199-966(+)